jgi:hypothetical protein
MADALDAYDDDKNGDGDKENAVVDDYELQYVASLSLC